MCFIWLLFSLSDFFRHLRKCWRRCCSGVVWAADVCKKCVAMINFTFHLLLIRRFLSQQKPALLIIRLLNGTFTLAPTFSPILSAAGDCFNVTTCPGCWPWQEVGILENLWTWCIFASSLQHHYALNFYKMQTFTVVPYLVSLNLSLVGPGYFLDTSQCPLMRRPIRTTVEKNASKSAT